MEFSICWLTPPPTYGKIFRDFLLSKNDFWLILRLFNFFPLKDQKYLENFHNFAHRAAGQRDAILANYGRPFEDGRFAKLDTLSKTSPTHQNKGLNSGQGLKPKYPKAVSHHTEISQHLLSLLVIMVKSYFWVIMMKPSIEQTSIN